MTKPRSSSSSKSQSEVLVIGGGIAGVAVAESLNRGGLTVHLVEKQPDIGGHAADMGCKATDVCMRCNVCVADKIFRNFKEKISKIKSGPRTHLHVSAKVLKVQPGGNGSRFTAVLELRGGRRKKVDVDFIVAAIGYQPFDPAENSSYHYAAIPNVITGVEAERQLAEKHRLFRPSDQAGAKRVAFIQCVGSRTEEVHRRPEDTDYCSTVCCSYALRMAQLIKHQTKDSEISVFYMDIQKFGKGFEEFHAQCKDKMRFIRSRPYELQAGSEGAVLLKYSDSTGVHEEPFDLAVLSVGIRPPSDALDIADKLTLPIDEYGFFGLKQTSAHPKLQVDGVYVAGANESPKDIAGCIAQAQSVSAAILSSAGIEKAKNAKLKISRDVAVIGGGLVGLQTALALARLNHRVILIHSGIELGGSFAPELCGHIETGIEESEDAARKLMIGMIDEVKKENKIKLYLNNSVKTVAGEQGSFSLTLNSDGKQIMISAGAIVLATGSDYGAIGQDNTGAIIGMLGIVEKMRAGERVRRVAFLMDISGEHGREAWVGVLSVAERMSKNGAQVKVYCRNARVAATGMESLYRRARTAGAVVVKFDELPMVVDRDGKAVVKFIDPIVGVELMEEFDLAVMVDRQTWRESEKIRRQIAGLRGGPEGELQYDNIWLLPGLTNRPGVFVAGGARGDSECRTALTDGLAVANEIHSLLSGDEINRRDDVAAVDAEKCVLCLTCLRVCPHGAISIDDQKKAASPSSISCKRCGTCVTECPARAIVLPGFTDEQITKKILFNKGTVVFACENSALPAAELAGYKPCKSVNIIKVPCVGDVDPKMVLNALESGAQKVMIIGCHPESCQYLSGSGRAKKRMQRLSGMLEKAGFDGSLVSFNGIASVEPEKFMEYVK